MTATLRDLVVFVLAGLVARWAALAFMSLVDYGHKLPILTVTGLVVAFVACLLALRWAWLVGLARWRREGGVSAPLGALAVLAVLAVAHHRSLDGAYTRLEPTRRALGHFPYEAGSVLEDVRGDYRQVAHIGPDGLRRCGPEDAPTTADTTVVLIGDSYVFGQGITDDATLCWKLRAQAPDDGTWAFRNAGQAGASLYSYVDTAAYAVETLQADVLVVGLLVPEDGDPIDVNRTPLVMAHPAFQVGMAVLAPDVLRDFLSILAHDGMAEGLLVALFRHDLERLADLATRTRTPTFVYVYPSRGTRWFLDTWGWHDLGAFQELIREVGADTPYLTLVPDMVPPAGGEPYIPGDGHPTAEGNAYFARELWPFVQAAAEAQ